MTMTPGLPPKMKPESTGFTLIELVVVIVIIGFIASTFVIFFKPAIDSYLAVGRRAGLTDMTDTAMRRMTRDIRMAVPNSIRLATSRCAEMIPTSAGGRYRAAPDTVWDGANPGNLSKPMDTSSTVSEFDVMTALTTPVANGDWVVIDNQNTDDVYAGDNRAEILSVDVPPAASPPLGMHRIKLKAAKQFPSGYDGGRFNIVPNAQNAVFYVCDSPGKDAGGDGTGKLYRFANYGFIAAGSSICPTPATMSVAATVLASKVESCSFIYDPNHGATQQSGFIEVQIKVTEHDESVSLIYGAHVDNVP